MVVGDYKKYLTCLIALKEDPPASGKLEAGCREMLSIKGIEAKTVAEAKNHPKLREVIQAGLNKANQKAISKAQHVQAFHLLTEDFSVDNGLLTPTLKLKRKEVVKKYNT